MSYHIFIVFFLGSGILECVCVSQFLCPLFHDGHIGCSHILAVTDSAAVNVGRECSECVCIFKIVSSFFLEEYPQVELLAQMVVLFFLMWTIFKVFIEFVTTLFLLYVLAAFFFFFWLSHIWDLNSPTREGAHTPFVGM